MRESSLCSRLQSDRGKVDVGVAFHDLLDNEVSRGAKGDVVGGPSGHARVQESDHRTLRVEDEGSGVALG